jgi:hypothetical protein
MIAYLNLRYLDDTRAQIFRAGLTQLGYTVMVGLSHNPGPRDIMVTWNRIGHSDYCANVFEGAGRPVIVAENASWGNDFAGDHWFHIALHYHNESGRFPLGNAGRWDRLGVQLAPFRSAGETVVLPSRGIGPAGPAMPSGWLHSVQSRGRVRNHPGQRKDIVSLEQDLARAGRVVTWGSGAAIKALMMGIPVESHMPMWIGEQDNTLAGRLDMFRRLAWAQWRHSEIESGHAFRCLLLAHAA